MVRDGTELKTLTGSHTSRSWYMFLAYCTTTFQLCIMQLLLALMTYKANTLILFLETACPECTLLDQRGELGGAEGTCEIPCFMGYLCPNPGVGMVCSCECPRKEI